MIIVVWTDESGDDILYLESLIQKCKRRNVLVSVVGPTAVLGSEQGRHHWVDKNTGFALLAADQTRPGHLLAGAAVLALLARFSLGSLDHEWGDRGQWHALVRRAASRRLLSGVGPYALTRLALETGGNFTLLDRKEDRGPFDWEVMKKYLPDYGSADEYVQSVNSKPLRQGCFRGRHGNLSGSEHRPPVHGFRVASPCMFPYPIWRPYYTARTVSNALLREAVPQQQILVKISNRVVEEALAHFPKDGMESDYRLERHPRWRAWYDLTRGRLLAMSTRQSRILMACDKLMQSNSLKPETNHVVLKPTSNYLAGSTIEPRAREAFRLLTRCVKENPGTPWELLAKWELAHELGIEIQEIVVPVPTPGPSIPRKPDPPITFPNL